MTPVTITQDRGTITCLVLDYNQRVHEWQVMLGNDGVTKIEAYNEPGQAAHVPWFAIWCDVKLVRRINAVFVVEVMYDRSPKPTT